MSTKPSPTGVVPVPPLTARQTDCVAAIARGLSIREAAEYLDLAEGTVQHHIKWSHHRVGTSNLQGLTAWFLTHRSIGPRITIERNEAGAIDIRAVRADGLTAGWATYTDEADYLPALRHMIEVVL